MSQKAALPSEAGRGRQGIKEAVLLPALSKRKERPFLYVPSALHPFLLPALPLPPLPFAS